MKFIDEVKIEIKSGNGGNGSVSFRREKFVAFGGPDGGSGGTGGHVFIQGDENINTLMHYRGRKQYFARSGEGGRGSQMDGPAGEDLILKVPVGTLIYNQDTEELMYLSLIHI